MPAKSASADPFCAMDDPQYEGRPIAAIKRATDCAFALLLLILTAPIILAGVLLVKLTSKGPGIYSQVRLGRSRREFVIYKIRTMRQDSEAKTGPRWAELNDPRVTFVGRILRATHIDELPQLWNVIRGDMSLVGPRPERPEIVKSLEPLIPNYADRLDVLPGVTGLAQVYLPADTSTACVRRKLRYDLYYVQNGGLWLDLRLILATAVKPIGLLKVARAVLRIPAPDRTEPTALETYPLTRGATPQPEMP